MGTIKLRIQSDEDGYITTVRGVDTDDVESGHGLREVHLDLQEPGYWVGTVVYAKPELDLTITLVPEHEMHDWRTRALLAEKEVEVWRARYEREREALQNEAEKATACQQPIGSA